MPQETTYQMNGKPYYIIETDKGIFQATNAYSIKDNNIFWYFNEDVGQLAIGKDISEVPTRSLTLIVKVPPCDLDVHHLLEEGKKFASITMYDYFSFEKYGNKLSRGICIEGNNTIFEFRPRLFKKIFND